MTKNYSKYIKLFLHWIAVAIVILPFSGYLLYGEYIQQKPFLEFFVLLGFLFGPAIIFMIRTIYHLNEYKIWKYIEFLGWFLVLIYGLPPFGYEQSIFFWIIGLLLVEAIKTSRNIGK